MEMLNLVNQSEIRMPQAFLRKLHAQILKRLQKKTELKNRSHLKYDVTIVFLDPKQAKALNKEFRKKNYATDVLSFAPADPMEELGELIICPQVILKQAKEHQLTFKQELAYMVLHGMLHLLGYDHEKNKTQAKEMFALQDEIFESLLHVDRI